VTAYTVSLGGGRDSSDHLQTKKHKDVILATSSSTKVSSLFKGSSMGENELKWRPQKGCSHIATLNTTSTSAQVKVYGNCFFICFIENYPLSGGGGNEATATDVLGQFSDDQLCKGLALSHFLLQVQKHLVENQ
jgi:hypothetical protein